jgi:putative flippase GtrA
MATLTLPAPTVIRNAVQFTKYSIVAGIGLGIHLGIIAGLVELGGLHYTVAFLSALPITFGVKFTLDKHWTFRV